MDYIENSYFMILGEVAKQNPPRGDLFWVQRAVKVAYSGMIEIEKGNPTDINLLRHAIVDLICILNSELIYSNDLKEEMKDIINRLSLEASTRYTLFDEN